MKNLRSKFFTVDQKITTTKTLSKLASKFSFHGTFIVRCKSVAPPERAAVIFQPFLTGYITNY